MSSPDDQLYKTVPVLPDKEETDEKNEEQMGKEDDDGAVGEPGMITRHIYLMNPEKLSRDVILRRIRHRKRVNKVKNAVHSLFSPTKDTGSVAGRSNINTNNGNRRSMLQPQRSLDDAFSAP